LTISQGNLPTYYFGTISDGAGRVGLAVRSGTLILASSNNFYSGDTSIFSNAGTFAPPVLQLNVQNALPYGPGAGNVSITGSGLLDIFGNLTNINGLSGNGTVDSSLFSGTLVVGNNNATSTFSGSLTNSGSFYGAYLSLNKVGSGTLTLSGTNTYLGGTTVENGTLVVTDQGAIADGTSLAVGDPSLLSQFEAPIVPAPAIAAGAATTSVTSVPEPSTLALVAGFLGAAAASRCWRRRKSE
jgi:autotransporter-associated beta strand protein